MNIHAYKKIPAAVSGFTLVETMVAIAILSMAILGTFTAVQASLQDSSFAKDQVTAFYLAQEAVEYVRNIRDTNALQNIATPGTNWLTYLTIEPDGTTPGPCAFGQTCKIDVANDDFVTHPGITPCPGGPGTCGVLDEDTSGDINDGLFGYVSGWTPTQFDREISFTSVSAHEVDVNVTISWTSGRFSKSFTVQQILFDWH